MAVSKRTSDVLCGFFPAEFSSKVREVYEIIPSSLEKFLKQKTVLNKLEHDNEYPPVIFDDGTGRDPAVEQFFWALRDVVEKRFQEDKVKVVKSEEIIRIISEEYNKKCQNRAKRGEKMRTTLEICKTLDDEKYRYISVYIYVRVIEEREKHFFTKDTYKYTCFLSVELNGVVIDAMRAAEFVELLRKDVQGAIQTIEQQYRLTWSSFMGKSEEPKNSSPSQPPEFILV